MLFLLLLLLCSNLYSWIIWEPPHVPGKCNSGLFISLSTASRQCNCCGRAHLQTFLLLPQFPGFVSLSLHFWEFPYTYPLSAMLSCLFFFFFASWGADSWHFKASVEVHPPGVHPCSLCSLASSTEEAALGQSVPPVVEAATTFQQQREEPSPG